MPVNSTTSNARPQPQVTKPPSPPHTDDSLKSINDLPSTSGTLSDSPESLNSVSNDQPSLFGMNTFDTAAIGGHGLKTKPSSSSTSQSSFSSPSTDQSDFNALWASLYPNGVQAGLQQAPARPQQNNSALLAQREYLTNPALANPSPYSLLNSQPDFMSFGNAGVNLNPPAPVPAPATDFNRLAFRDPSAAQADLTNTAAPADTSGINWADFNDNSMNDFLASLTGTQQPPAEEPEVEDEFTAQLRQIFGTASPSAALGLPPTNSLGGMSGFSPNNYLNMSPSPLNASQSPQSQSSKSNSASPASTNSLSSNPTSVSAGSISKATAEAIEAYKKAGMNVEAIEAYKKKVGTDVVHIVDSNGNIIKPSDIWVKFGMQHENAVDHLMIDDLCDSMRAKATCVDGQCSIGIDDAERVMKYSKRLVGNLNNGKTGD